MATGAVVDASLLLTLGDASALHLLWDDPRYVWHVTPIVRAELLSEPTRTEIANALLRGQLAATEIDVRSPAEMAALAHWSRALDAGEAEAIAVAVSRGWIIGIEDLFAQRKLTATHGSATWVNAATLLLHAIDDGRLRLGDADSLFRRLDCYAGYVKRGITSLAQLRT